MIPNSPLRVADAVATRRMFLTSLGALSTGTLRPARLGDRTATAPAGSGRLRGLAPAADYEFDPGLVYERLLNKHKAVVKVMPGQWLNGDRISTHLFNTDGDVDILVEALKTELA